MSWKQWNCRYVTHQPKKIFKFSSPNERKLDQGVFGKTSITCSFSVRFHPTQRPTIALEAFQLKSFECKSIRRTVWPPKGRQPSPQDGVRVPAAALSSICGRTLHPIVSGSKEKLHISSRATVRYKNSFNSPRNYRNKLKLKLTSGREMTVFFTKTFPIIRRMDRFSLRARNGRDPKGAIIQSKKIENPLRPKGTAASACNDSCAQ